jgi:23S rRNA (adenine2030-N6)-methyltransferase
MAWYPIKQGAVAARLHRRIVDAGVRRVLVAEMCVHPDDSRAGLNGSGLVTINPPWQVAQDLQRVLPALHAALSPDGAGRTRVALLAGE